MTLQLNTYIEDCIAQKDPLIKIMRLVCMQSVCNNGLKQKVLDFYKREILQVTEFSYCRCHFKTQVIRLAGSFMENVTHSSLHVDSLKN